MIPAKKRLTTAPKPKRRETSIPLNQGNEAEPKQARTDSTQRANPSLRKP